MKNKRNSNIEVLRIVAMMGVVACHYINAISEYAVFPQFTWFFAAIVRGMAIPLVNVFVVITGYFMIHSTKLSLNKFVGLIATVAYYGLLRTIAGWFQGDQVTLIGLIKSIFPYFYGTHWFIKTYLILYLLSPFINKSLLSLTREAYRLLLLIQITLFSVWYSCGHNAPIVDDGYGIINFITLYIIGGYIRQFEYSCEYMQRCNIVRCVLGFFGCAGLTSLISFFINPFGYSFITSVLAAAFIFIAVVKMKERYIQCINQIAETNFDVFFVHGTWLFELLRIDAVVGSIWIVPHLAFSLLISYVIGIMSGIVRKKVFSMSVNRLLNNSKKNQVFYI